MRLAILLAACASQPPVAGPSNHQIAPRAHGQLLAPRVSAEIRQACTLPHAIAITIDGVPRATVKIRCKEVPAPQGPNQVIVTDSSVPSFTGPAFEVPPGHHLLGARDAVTGVSASSEVDFPAHEQDQPDIVDDTILVIVFDEVIKLGVARRDRIIEM
jgi:hypothetical protein